MFKEAFVWAETELLPFRSKMMFRSQIGGNQPRMWLVYLKRLALGGIILAPVILESSTI